MKKDSLDVKAIYAQIRTLNEALEKGWLDDLPLVRILVTQELIDLEKTKESLELTINCEDFLPEQDSLMNYRIKKVTDGHSTRYYPQEKWFGLFWVNMFGYDRWYPSFEEANRRICYTLRKPTVEYLEVDCGENK